MRSKGERRWRNGREVRGGEREISRVYHFNEVSWLPHCSSVLLLPNVPRRRGVILAAKVLLWLPLSPACHGGKSELIWKHDLGSVGPEMDYWGRVMWVSSVPPQIEQCLDVINTHEVESISHIYCSVLTLWLMWYLFSLPGPQSASLYVQLS